MCAPCECLVSEEVRRGHQIPRNWLIHTFIFETNSWCVAHGGLELIILLPQLPECWLITGGYPHIQALVCILNVPPKAWTVRPWSLAWCCWDVRGGGGD